jgi:hypothetical protein
LRWLFTRSQNPDPIHGAILHLAFLGAVLAFVKSQKFQLTIGGIFKMANMAPKINREIY